MPNTPKDTIVIANFAADDAAGAVVVTSGVADVVGVGWAEEFVAPAGADVTDGAGAPVESVVAPPQAAIARMRTVELASLRMN